MLGRAFALGFFTCIIGAPGFIIKDNSYKKVQGYLHAVSKEYVLKGPAKALYGAGNSGKTPNNVARDVQRTFERMCEHVTCTV